MPYLSQACVRESAEALGELLDAKPEIGLVLGSGLGSVADSIEGARTIPYRDVPRLPTSTARGHQGCFVAGTLAGRDVIAMQGRLHGYEGYDAAQTVYPIRVMAALGIRQLIITNASGAINTGFSVGDIVLVTDHINLTGANPLIGVHDDEGGVVTPDMTDAYSPRLRALACEAAGRLGVKLAEGVYIGVLGPSFETPAEIRAFRVLGADLVGMSSVHEVIEAAHLGLEVCALSLVTNMAAGIEATSLDGTEIVGVADKASSTMSALIAELIASL